MRSLMSLVSTSALILSLSACGGGGGGGGGIAGFLPTGTTPVATPSATTTPVTAATPVTESNTSGSNSDGATPAPADTTFSAVSTRDGKQLVADGSGALTFKPGNTLTVAFPSAPISRWTVTSNPAGAITTSNVTHPSSGSWKALVANTTAADATLTLTVDYLDGTATRTKDLVFKVSAPDTRNGDYFMYTAAGVRYRFSVNFDTTLYRLREWGGADVSPSGHLEEAANEPGTYVMADASTTFTAKNPNRFRVSGDVLVGAYPVSTQFPNAGGSRMFGPFVAAKATALVTQQADLDGIYNVARLSLAAGSGSNAPSLSYRVGQFSVTANGTKLKTCNETVTISRITSCAAGVATYTGTADTEGHWRFVNDADATDIRTLGVVGLAGQKLFLEAGVVPSNPSSQVFGVAVPDSSTWVPVTSRGGDNMGNWSTYTFGATTFNATGFGFDGSDKTASLTLAASGANQPLGLRYVMEPSSVSFTFQSSKLTVMIGGVSWYGGYLQLGLID